MIEYTITPTETTARAKVYDPNGNGFSLEAVTSPPDFAALLDTVTDELLESMLSDRDINIKDLATALVAKAKREIMGEVLMRLLCILGDSDNIQLDIECLISCVGSNLRDIPDSSVASKYSQSRQAFSARKKSLMRRLDLSPPPHSKSLRACETYKKLNRRNGIID